MARQNINAKTLKPLDIWTTVIKDLTPEQKDKFPVFAAFRQMIHRERAIPETANVDKEDVYKIKIEVLQAFIALLIPFLLISGILPS